MSHPAEHEVYSSLMDHLAKAVEDCTYLGMLRGDQRWVAIADNLEKMRALVREVATKRLS